MSFWPRAGESPSNALNRSQRHPANRSSELVQGGKALPVAIGEFGRLVTLGLWAVLSEDRALNIIGNNFDYDELLQLITERRAPAAIVLDAARAGAAAVRGLREAAPTVGLLVLAQGQDRLSVARLLEEGVTECLSIDAAPDEIRAAVRRAADSDEQTTMTAPRQERRVAGLDAIDQLTPREREVLGLLAAGRSRAVIAVELHIAEVTVDTHVKNIYRKLDVSSRAEVLGIELPPR